MPIDIIPALGAGSLLGMLALFPGFHFAMVLLVAGPWILNHFTLASGILCMASAVCVSKCMHTLAVVYHPVSGNNIASADPAQRLAAAGQGRYATALMGDAVWGSATTLAILLGAVVLFQTWLQTDLIKQAIKLISSLSGLAILVWIIALLASSKNLLATIFVFGSSAALGVIALMHPAVEGSTHTMTPLLTGMFAFPVLLNTLFEKHSSYQRIEVEKQDELETDPGLKLIGFITGILSVGLPGLGTSSLVSVSQGLTESDAEYLTMASFAETTGEMMALILGILSIASRSSDAAIIQQALLKHTGEFAIHPTFMYLLLGTMLVSCWVGLKLVNVVSFPYRVMLNLIPVKLQALIVASAMIGLVWHHTSMWGMGIVLAGTLIHLGAKQLYVSNQVLFACMVIPMLMNMAQFNPFR